MNKRHSGIELLRILSILCIVAVHYACHGGSFENGNNLYLSYILANYGQIGVGCFVFMGSWFMCDKEFKIERLFNIYKQVLFYSLGITALFYLIYPSELSFSEIVRSALPIIYCRYWFVTPYLFLLLLAPYITNVFKSISPSDYRKIALVLFVLISLIPSIFINTDPFGYNIFRFVLYYVLAYGIKHKLIKIEFKSNTANLLVGGGISLLMLMFSVCCLYIGNYMTIFIRISKYYQFNFSTIPVVTSAIYIFLFFKNLNIKNMFINTVAKHCFSVYLISEHVLLQLFLWRTIFRSETIAESQHLIYLFSSIAIILFVYITCILIDMVADKLLLSKITGNRLNNFIMSLAKKI